MHDRSRPEMQTFKPSKIDSIKYVGRRVDKHGVRPDREVAEEELTLKATMTGT